MLMGRRLPQDKRGDAPRHADPSENGLTFPNIYVIYRAAMENMQTRALRRGHRGAAQSLSGNSLLGRTGHWPAPPGGSPGGMGSARRGNEDGSFAKRRRALPVGGSPTGTGGSPVLPIFQTGSQNRPIADGKMHE